MLLGFLKKIFQNPNFLLFFHVKATNELPAKPKNLGIFWVIRDLLAKIVFKHRIYFNMFYLLNRSTNF